MDPVPLIVDPSLAGLSEAETIARLRQVVRDGGAGIAGPVLSPPADTPAPAGVFDPAALFAEMENRSEQYTMPNGQPLWVHPVSIEEAGWLNRRAVREVAGMGLLRVDVSAAERQRLDREAQVELQFRGQVWQVIACCRVGPRVTDPKVFTDKHAEALRRNPGFVDAIQSICQLSNQLSQGQSESAALREMLTGFFGQLGSWLETLSGQLSTDSLTDSRNVLSDFAHSVSVISQHPTLSPRHLSALCLVMQAPMMTSEPVN